MRKLNKRRMQLRMSKIAIDEDDRCVIIDGIACFANIMATVTSTYKELITYKQPIAHSDATTEN